MQGVKTVDICLPDEVVDYLESLDYEVGGLQVLHTHALNAGTPAEKVEEICQRFQEKFQEYQLAQQELWAQYGGDRHNCRWWVNFKEGVLHIAQQQT